jgi:hypothetical protein
MQDTRDIDMRHKCIEHAKLSQQIYIKLKRQILQLPISDDICKIIVKFVGIRPIDLRSIEIQRSVQFIQ